MTQAWINERRKLLEESTAGISLIVAACNDYSALLDIAEAAMHVVNAPSLAHGGFPLLVALDAALERAQ